MKGEYCISINKRARKITDPVIKLVTITLYLNPRPNDNLFCAIDNNPDYGKKSNRTKNPAMILLINNIHFKNSIYSTQH